MGLGLFFGRMTPIRPSGRHVYWFSRALTDVFKKEYEYLTCPELLNLDVDKNYAEYQSKGLWVNRCRGLISSVTGMAHDIVVDELKQLK